MDYYSQLGVSRTCNLTDLKEGYVKQTKRVIKLETGSIRDNLLQGLDDALATLSDPITREKYDIRLNATSDITYVLPADTIIFDYSRYRKMDKMLWSDISGGFTAQDILTLFSKILSLPNQDVQLPILVSALLTPSAMSTTLPLIFCWGQEGSGKSVICKLAAKLWGVDALSSSSTAASLRNTVQEGKFIYSQGVQIEQNCGIVINDFNEKTLKSNNLLLSFLKAYNREESRIQMSSPDKDGSNVSFDVFSNRVISSVTPFFALDDYRELARRMIVVHCEKANSVTELIPMTDINFKDINKVFNDIWQNVQMCEKFANTNIRRAFAQSQTTLLSIDRLDTVQDILKAGVATGIFDNARHAVDTMILFEQANNLLKLDHGDRTKGLLREFMDAQIKEKYRFGLPQTISPLAIKSYIQVCAQEAKIDSLPKQSKINELLHSLGYKLSNKTHLWSKK